MDDLELALYSRLSQKFIEVFDEYRAIQNEVAEFYEEGQEVPFRLAVQLETHKMKVEKMANDAFINFNKKADEFYRDGWNFWMKEDAELREQRYGKR